MLLAAMGLAAMFPAGKLPAAMFPAAILPAEMRSPMPPEHERLQRALPMGRARVDGIELAFGVRRAGSREAEAMTTPSGSPEIVA